VESDPDGRVRRIQRYYHFVTWPFTAGISCSLLPVSCALLALDLPFGSLPELRRALAARGIASRDIPLAEGAFDVSQERGLLALNERVVLESAGREKGGEAPAERVLAGKGCRIHPSARIIGPVVLQDEVEVEEGATIVGPTAIGAGSSVGRGAIVAQCLVGRGSQVAAGTNVRHRVLFGEVTAEPASSSAAAAPLAPLPSDGRAGSHELAFENRRRPLYPRFKRAAEAVASALGLAALSPFLLFVAALVKLASKGPVLYGDEREGKDGRLFRCWKFRTMVAGAHARQRSLQSKNQVDGPQFKIEADPRVTRLGAFLRDTCIDELPQLINVVVGEMSLVGPRPSPFRENQMCIPWREARLSVRPGITGLWQVCRRKRAKGDFHQWIYYDLLYVRHQSLWVDLKILVATLVSLGGKWSVPLSWIVAPRLYFERRRSPRDPDLADARSTV
jgi:lipopolysaccharide/colanic/teichoic acid biosynthesis glycosyltransferase